jgi:tetratricopeptide (TPR) repeat protein
MGRGGLKEFITSRIITFKLTPIKLLSLFAVLLALIVVSPILWHLAIPPKPRPLASASGQPALAVLAFENKSGDSKLDNWRDALAELLAASLSQSKSIRVVPSDEMYLALKRLGLDSARKYSSQDIEKIAAQTQATHVLRGSFIKAGENFVITACLKKPGTSGSPATLRFEARDENEIIPKVDEMARRVKEELSLTADQIENDFEKQAGKITTSSPEALKYYVEGERFRNRAEGLKARAFYKKAVEIDPEFAMAYGGLAITYADERKIAEALKYVDKARALSNRLPEYQRQLIEAVQLFWNYHYSKAIDVLEELLKTYPGFTSGHKLLGWVYDAIGDEKKAINQLELVVQGQRTAAPVYDLSLHYMHFGLYQKAEEICRSFIQGVEDDAMLHESLALNHMCRRQFDLALDEAEQSYRLDPYFKLHETIGKVLICAGDFVKAEKIFAKDQEDAWYLWHIALIRGKFSEAVRLARMNLEKSQWALNIKPNEYAALPFVLEKAGRYAEALKAIEIAQRATVQNQAPCLLGKMGIEKAALVIKGKIQAEMGSFEEAQRTADDLNSLVKKGADPTDLRWCDYLLGLVELGRKNYLKATDHFTKAIENLSFENGEDNDPHALLFGALAQAYDESGHLDIARKEYERITQLTSGRLNHGDIYSRAYYMLGKIAEKQGDKKEAAEYFRKFLDLWKDADPGLLEVGDAKRRLAGLQN